MSFAAGVFRSDSTGSAPRKFEERIDQPLDTFRSLTTDLRYILKMFSDMDPEWELIRRVSFVFCYDETRLTVSNGKKDNFSISFIVVTSVQAEVKQTNQPKIKSKNPRDIEMIDSRIPGGCEVTCGQAEDFSAAA
ncbi:hypothetical protein MG293_010875 [Ovis ammon polii]|uniref:Uncharacterized protein n=1 Tax=Ovis ammon polii TaxID=230172 RepID=A0AAD4U4U1_OVIAM|nr:hypothetical protein MG293_010875 [Ovis ammon polii]